MTAEELITFINVSNEIIREKKQLLLDSINEKVDVYADRFKLTESDTNAVREYFKQYQHTADEAIHLYNRIKELSEGGNSIFKTIWIAKDDEYIVAPTEIPVAFFQAIIISLNAKN